MIFRFNRYFLPKKSHFPVHGEAAFFLKYRIGLIHRPGRVVASADNFGNKPDLHWPDNTNNKSFGLLPEPRHSNGQWVELFRETVRPPPRKAINENHLGPGTDSPGHLLLIWLHTTNKYIRQGFPTKSTKECRSNGAIVAKEEQYDE